ncbi:MAG: methyltransferase protein [Bacteroidetes bacterium]|jgi:SAM-dependent methyltransferase|nr:methyltransferase protein [Bacteroidota bacterium]
MSRVRSFIRSLQLKGFKGTAQTIFGKIVPSRAKNLKLYTHALADNVGLEIGGPSSLFDDGGALPVYAVLKRLDNCNFSNTTVWEGNLKEGTTFRFHKDKPLGRQFICEAFDLGAIKSASYDFVISSNTIEHVANPLKALFEWKRVVKDNGHLLLVAPHRDTTFDHNRPITSLPHIVEDYERHTGEDDMTHLDEILALHDLDMDPPAGDHESFRERSINNLQNRCLHQHVFNTELVVQLLDFIEFQIVSVDPMLPFNIAVLARKPAPREPVDNQTFLSSAATYRRASPFKSDRNGTFPQPTR